MYRGDGRNKLGAAIVEGIKEEPTSNWERNGLWEERSRSDQKKNNLLNYKAGTHVSSLRYDLVYEKLVEKVCSKRCFGKDLCLWGTLERSVF